MTERNEQHGFDWRKHTEHLWTLLVLSGIFVAFSLAPGALAQDEIDTSIENARQSTVFVMQTFDEGGAQAISCVGSGTLVSDDGLILTNAHLAEPLGPCQGEEIVIALPVRLDEPPVPTYLANVVAIDERLSLAVLQIAGSLDGSLVDPATLNLPFAPVGDVNGLQPGSSVTAVGYPDIGTTPVNTESRILTSTISETSGSRFAWVRMDSAIGGVMTGGGIYDGEGNLVGVPTGAPATSGDIPGPSCLSIQDTTGDGAIDASDSCVPVAPEVLAVRPISYAAPLIEAAREQVELTQSEGNLLPDPSDAPYVERLFISAQITDHGLPTEIITQAPDSTSSLFVFFDFHNMRHGTPYELRVSRDGLDMPQMSAGPLPWGGAYDGLWYIGTENVIWQPGQYDFTLLINGEAAASTSIPVGGSADGTRITDPVFTAHNSGSQVGSAGVVFPQEIEEIRATFDYTGIRDGAAFREVWYLDGSVVSDFTRLWEGDPSGRTSVSATNLSGLPIGTYRVEIYINDIMRMTGDVTLAGSRDVQTGQPQAFNNYRFFSDITRDGTPLGAEGPILPLGVTKLLLFTNWDFIPLGTEWTYRWYLDGRLIGSQTRYWENGGVGENLWLQLASDDPLPEGEYAVDVLVSNTPMFSASVAVGSGTQPVSGQIAEVNEVFISGQVLDALTGEGVPGALVFVLDVRFESAQFLYDESQILTQAITDREGNFTLPRGLERSNYYTVYAFADGYITVLEDFFIVSSEQPSPSTIEIRMNQP